MVEENFNSKKCYGLVTLYATYKYLCKTVIELSEAQQKNQ